MTIFAPPKNTIDNTTRTDLLACNLVKKMLKKMKNYLFTSESVSEGHPDKVADQISDAILDEFLRQDPEAKVACETFCTTGLVVVGGEVTSEHAYVDIPATVRRVIDRIGYNKAEYRFDAASCGILQSRDPSAVSLPESVIPSARLDTAFLQSSCCIY